MIKLKGKPKWESSKSIFWGLIFVVVMFAFWYSLAGSPLDEYRFMQRGILINAEIGECTQDYADRDSGQGGAYQRCEYSYKVSGNTYQGVSDFSQNVGEKTEIIYLPENPSVHREKLGAATGIFDFVFRKILVGAILLVMFVSGGIVIIKNGIKEFFGKNE